MYWEAKQRGGCARPASAGAPSHPHRLGAAVGAGELALAAAGWSTQVDIMHLQLRCDPLQHFAVVIFTTPPGYGRAPTATLHTSAGTALPTMALQSPQAMHDGGRGRLQAFAFSPGGFLGRGSFLGSSTSASVPTSPLDRRTLLYTRTVAGGTASQAVAAGGWGAAQQRQQDLQPEEPLPQRLLPAADLLDRLALLRRLVPTTDPAPRPPQLQCGGAAQPLYPPTAAPPGPHQPAANPLKRWAWDDSLVASGRPLAAGPAPGWRFCGEVEEALPGGAMPGCTAAALVSAAGDQAALLVVRSPRQHRLCLEEEQEGEEGAQWHAADRTAGFSGRRAAFRPPGPLKHKFGNKPQPRPRSAPGRGDQAPVAGLRDCGCRKSPRASGVPAAGAARRSVTGSGRPQPPAGSRRHLSWADAGLEAAAAAVPTRPRSAGLTANTAAPRRPALRQPLPGSSTETEPAIPERASPQLSSSGGSSGSGGSGSGGSGGSGLRRQADVTTVVEVTTGDGATDVVVVSSPQPARGLDEEGQDVLEVAVTSSPTHGSGSSSEVVVVQQRLPSPPPLPARPRQQPAAAAAGPAATRLTVSLPTDTRACSYSIRTDASSAGGAGSPGGSPGGSPIKAWLPAQQAKQVQQVQQATTTTVSVDVMASPPRRQLGAAPQRPQQLVERRREQQQQQPATPPDHLQQLAGEIRRREQSFNSLLAELEAIQQKCAKLSGPASAKALAAGGQTAGFEAAGAAAAAAGAGGSVGLTRPRSGRKAAAAGQTGKPGGGSEKDWSWQSLMDFEATIREQQRKVSGMKRGISGKGLPHMTAWNSAQPL